MGKRRRPTRKGDGKPASGRPAKEDPLAETRQRMVRINAYLDCIPAQFCLGFDHPLVKREQKNFDPEKAKPTSALLVEAAELDSDSKEVATKRARKADAQREGEQPRTRAAPQEEDQPNSRRELQEKLERRLAELREERRKRQSAVDKAKAQAVREARIGTGQVPEPKAQGQPAAQERQAPAGAGKPSDPTGEDGGPEVGRLVFEPKSAALPFGADVGKRGAKVRKMRAELRKQEAAAEKVRKAEERGEGDELRQKLALQKALMRVQGQKVHDDTGKLRKAQKAFDMRKKKGRDKRERQKDDIKKQHEEQQQKRKENLQKRAQNKKKNKRRADLKGRREE